MAVVRMSRVDFDAYSLYLKLPRILRSMVRGFVRLVYLRSLAAGRPHSDSLSAQQFHHGATSPPEIFALVRDYRSLPPDHQLAIRRTLDHCLALVGTAGRGLNGEPHAAIRARDRIGAPRSAPLRLGAYE
jgi:hypothetical protein